MHTVGIHANLGRGLDIKEVVYVVLRHTGKGDDMEVRTYPVGRALKPSDFLFAACASFVLHVM